MKLFRPGRLVVVGLCLLAVVVALWVVPSDEYILLPDTAKPVAPLVEVQGGRDPVDGGIYFVDVVYRKASLLERLFGGLHDGADLREPSAIIPHGLTPAEQRAVSLAEMRRSQRIAAAVALRTLGKKVTTLPAGADVAGVVQGAPADGVLTVGDVIVRVDGRRIRTPADVRTAMAGKRVGDAVRLTIRRGGRAKQVALETAPASDDSDRPVVGVYLVQSTEIRLPLSVDIDAGSIGGPSAGLAFALDVLEELGRDVDGGHRIAATGELLLSGEVRPIGGVKQKTIGAREAGVDAFLVPAGENAREARKYAEGLRIIPVKSFQQALQALATLPEKR